jgi:hypothetical protein
MKVVEATGALALLMLLAGCTQEQRVCRRMDELCGTEASECRALLTELKRTGGDEAVAKLSRCYADADSCAEAKGCEARVQVEAAASAVGDFFDSLTGDDEEREKKRER